MARRDDRGYREYLREEQRRQPGCPARELCRETRGQDTSAYWFFVLDEWTATSNESSAPARNMLASGSHSRTSKRRRRLWWALTATLLGLEPVSHTTENANANARSRIRQLAA